MTETVYSKKKQLTEKDYECRYCVHEKSEKLFVITNALIPTPESNELSQQISKGREKFKRAFADAADLMDMEDDAQNALTGSTVNVIVKRLEHAENHPRTYGWLFQCNEFPTENKE